MYLCLLGSSWASPGSLHAWASLSFLKACWSQGSWTPCMAIQGSIASALALASEVTQHHLCPILLVISESLIDPDSVGGN